MRYFLSLSLMALLFSSLCGCATIETMQVGGFTVRKENTEYAFSQVKTQAAFEFGCAQEQIELTVLDVYEANVMKIGASGCEHKAVYVRVGKTSQWVVNSEGSPK